MKMRATVVLEWNVSLSELQLATNDLVINEPAGKRYAAFEQHRLDMGYVTVEDLLGIADVQSVKLKAVMP